MQAKQASFIRCVELESHAQRVHPHCAILNRARAVEFIAFLTKRVLEGRNVFLPRVSGAIPGRTHQHAEGSIGNSVIELADAYEPIPAANRWRFTLSVDDAYSSFKRAIDGWRDCYL